MKETFEPAQTERLARLLARIYKDIANTVTKEEFRELTELLRDSLKGLIDLQRLRRRQSKG